MGRNLIEHPLILIVLLLIIIVVFGANKLPTAARSLGRSLRIFKSEIQEMKDDDKPAPGDGEPQKPLEGRVVDMDKPQEAKPQQPTRAEHRDS